MVIAPNMWAARSTTSLSVDSKANVGVPGLEGGGKQKVPSPSRRPAIQWRSFCETFGICHIHQVYLRTEVRVV